MPTRRPAGDRPSPPTGDRPHRPAGDRRGAVAVLFAIMAVPLIGLAGLAIDYGFWNETYSTLSLAASAAALNAAKVAAGADLNNDSNFLVEGATAGRQWFIAELGQGANTVTYNLATPTVSVTTSANNIVATVGFAGTENSIFGALFGRGFYPVSVSATVTIPIASYLEVVMMLDNSSSMGIGAGTSDMQTMLQNSPCDMSNEYTTNAAGTAAYSSSSNDPYGNFQTSYSGGTYDGAVPTPISSGSLTFYPAPGGTGAYYCSQTQVNSGACSHVEQCPTKVNGQPAYAGPPCVFACHWDGSKAAGLGTDLWAMARHSGVTLRLDLLKKATDQVLNSMQTNNIAALNNLSVGIYTFSTTLAPIYPGTGCTPQAFGCEAASGWTTAIGNVGIAPIAGSGVYTDTGIQPALASITGTDNTAIEEAMSSLATKYVTAAGDGSSATKPRKVLFLVTDGFEDDPNTGARQAMPSSACQPFKTLGYTVYVVYTPYYPIMHTWYLQNAIPIVEGSGTNSLTYNLQACATNSADYISATDQASLSAALLTFLKSALSAPATFTK